MKIGERFWQMLYPPRCVLCYELLEEQDREAGICPGCRQRLPLIREPACKKCGKELSDETAEYCPDCGNGEHRYERGYALFTYTDEVRGAIVRFKYQNQRENGIWFAGQIAGRYEREIRRMKADALVPVPLYKRKERQRGFNQARLLAEEIGKRTGLPVRELLVRRRGTAAQKELGREERFANLEDSFVLAPDAGSLPSAVILVDDIYTTGSTIDACAAILKKAGVRKIFFLTIAIGKC